ncbi:MAG: tRNA pseudouridine(13) synthase TruD [Candidatus Bathyarchaeia archaeon]|nr:tRNA pseudouridine(13) synthase TruD [Candidatus Bathyarchaeota archaeon]
MLRVPSIEENIGIKVYATESRGLGGFIKRYPEDFIVEEVLTDGSRASVQLENNRLSSLAERGRYLICVLVKRGWDTILAIEEIAKALGISSDRIGFAGIKDADALAAQYISIGGISSGKLTNINIKGLSIKSLGYSDEEISPEKLFGNRFTVTVRSIRVSEKTAKKRIERINGEIAEFGGMPNFFGHQRFGTIRPITHIVGKYIVMGNFKDAVLTFLAYQSPFESARIREIRRELYEKMDFNSALRRFPKSLIYERLILEHLSKSPNDYLGALYKVPLNLRRLFVQAYQSYLFNRFLSERIKRKIPIKEALEGDYVIELDENGLPRGRFFKVEASNLKAMNDELKHGRAALGIPLIGPKQPLSEGLQGEIEREILEEEGINREDFKRARAIKVDVSGRLRLALVNIIGLKVDIIDDVEKPGRKAAIFKFTLPRGAYATILLREYMKPATDEQLIKCGF